MTTRPTPMVAADPRHESERELELLPSVLRDLDADVAADDLKAGTGTRTATHACGSG